MPNPNKKKGMQRGKLALRSLVPRGVHHLLVLKEGGVQKLEGRLRVEIKPPFRTEEGGPDHVVSGTFG